MDVSGSENEGEQTVTKNWEDDDQNESDKELKKKRVVK